MNQATIGTIAGAVAAMALAVVQSMQGVKINDNHEQTHARIDGVETTVMNTEVVQLHVDAFNEQQAIQDGRLDSLEEEYPLRVHDEE